MFIDSEGVMELDFSQIALEVSHHGYLLVTHLTTQEHCYCDIFGVDHIWLQSDAAFVYPRLDSTA